MMIERDLRQTAYNDCKKAQRWEMVLIIALLSGMGLVFGFAMAPVSPYLGCGIGLLFIVLIGCFVRAFRKGIKGTRNNQPRHLDGSRSGGAEGGEGGSRR